MIAHWIAFGACMCACSFISGAVLSGKPTQFLLFLAQAIALISVGVMIGGRL